jgi:hypothetical protein
MKKILCAVASLGIIALLCAVAPDIRRYVRMVSM